MRNQDALVEFDFIGDTRRPIRISRYRHNQLTLDLDLVHWPAPSDSSGTSPVVRMILDPRHEHALEAEAHGLWRIPERCKGLCLVYLRDGVDVVSRPVPVLRPGAPAAANTGDLVSALVIPDYEGRQQEIAKALCPVGTRRRPKRGSQLVTDCCDQSEWSSGKRVRRAEAAADEPRGTDPSPVQPPAMRESAEPSGHCKMSCPFLWLAMPAVRVGEGVAERLRGRCGRARRRLRERKRRRVRRWRGLASLRNELIALEPALETTFRLVGLPATHALQYLHSGI